MHLKRSIALALTANVILTGYAIAGGGASPPRFDVDAYCEWARDHGNSDYVGCVAQQRSIQVVFETKWDRVPADARDFCTNLMQHLKKVPPNYAIMLNCLVKVLKK